MARRSLFLSPEVLARLAGRVERQILTELVTVLERVRAALPLDAVEQALLERNLPAAVDAIGLQPVQNALYAIPERTRGLRADAFHAEAGTLPARLQQLATVQASLGAVVAQQPEVLAALERQDLRRIRGITQGTEQAIRNHLRRGLAQGLNPKETARQLRAVIGLTPQQEAAVAARRDRLTAQGRDPAQVERMVTKYADRQRRLRAESIARTETIAALEGGKQLQRERLVREGTLDPGQWVQEWQTAADERTCPICEPLDGETAPIGGTFPGGYRGPPAHPNCLTGDALVTAGPRITAATARVYRGPVHIVRTAGGKKLTATPNHPILTRRGFLAAGLLNVGDDLVCHRPAERKGPVDQDHQHRPATIQQVTESFGGRAGVLAREVPVAGPDFHGDGEGSEVAIVMTDGLLGHDDQTAILEPSSDHVLVERTMAAESLTGASEANLTLPGGDRTSNGGVRGHHLGGAALWAHPAPLERLRIGSTPRTDAVIAQPRDDDSAAHSETPREGKNGLALRESPDDLGLRHRNLRALGGAAGPPRNTPSDQLVADQTPTDPHLARHLIEGHALPVELDCVVSVERSCFDGHVYNLETVEGWFAANGILTHNCRCNTVIRLAALAGTRG